MGKSGKKSGQKKSSGSKVRVVSPKKRIESVIEKISSGKLLLVTVNKSKEKVARYEKLLKDEKETLDLNNKELQAIVTELKDEDMLPIGSRDDLDFVNHLLDNGWKKSVDISVVPQAQRKKFLGKLGKRSLSVFADGSQVQ